MAKTPPAGLVKFVDAIRFRLGALQRTLAPPPIAALDFITGMWAFQIAYALCELGIPDRLSDHPVSAESIATAISAPESSVYRLLRAASNIGLTREAPGRAFTSTPICKALRTEALGSIREFILFQGRCAWAHWGGLTDCVKTGRSAVETIHGKTPFEYFTSPEIADDFNRAMTGISAMTVDALLGAYSFAGFRTVADIGGGHGRLLGTILKQYPALHGVLLDLPGVVAGAPRILEELGVSDRCQVREADFFQPLPPVDADLYLMKSIIHDWADPDAVSILRNVRAQMRNDSRLALCEVVVPGPNQPSFAKYLDLEMLVHAGGKERTESEYAALFAAAGLRLVHITPTAGPMSLIEAQPV